jgi:hypothetical protein
MGKVDVVDLLISEGADLNIRDARTELAVGTAEQMVKQW